MEEKAIERVEEVVQQEGTQPIQETPTDVAMSEVERPPEAQAEPHANNAAETNLQRMREAKEKVERELVALQQQQRQQEQQPTYGDDDLVEGKQLRQELSALREQMDETKLRSRYQDWDKVVNPDNLARLKEADPEFAETVGMSSSSLYAKGTSTYKRLKDLGIYVADTHAKERQVAQDNAAKPKPLNAVSPQQGDSPLSMANAFANGLTDELKRKLWKETQECAKKS